MYFLILGAFLGLCSAFPLSVTRNVKRLMIVWAGSTIWWTFVAWLFPFQLVGPLGGIGLQGRVVCALAVTSLAYLVIGFIQLDYNRKKARASFRVMWFSGISAIVASAGALTLWFVTTSGILHADDYRAFVAGSVTSGTWSEEVSAIDPAHLRQVSRKQAEWKGNKALSQVEGETLGSRYKVGQYVDQKVENELVQVAPLEYQKFFVWFRQDFTPGYVVVSSEDPNRDPKLVSDRKLKYVESAYLWDNLWRHVVMSGHILDGLVDPTFELDDDGNPYYVFTRFELRVGYSGLEPVGALVVNPETGDMQPYTMDDLPEWVDRIVPEKQAYKRLDWYGKFIQGFWNSIFGENNVVVPTDHDLTLVWTDNGTACWFTGMTSPKDTDRALTSVMLMNSRTGTVREYRVSGGADETDVTGAVQTAVSNFKDLVPTPPIPVNAYGDLAWVVPVVNRDGVPQRIAIVSADASKVGLGENVGQALAEYRRKMYEAGKRVVAEDSATEERVVAVVERFAADTRGGNTNYLFTVLGDPRIFAGTSEVSQELPLTRLGDEVEIGFLETEETTVQAQSFDNHAIVSRVSGAQQRADAVAAEQLNSPKQ